MNFYETLYALRLPINFMPTLHNAVCKVSDSLDKLLNSIIQIDCTDGAIREKQIREQFDYIESTGLRGA